MFLSSELLWHLVRGGFSIPVWLAHVSAAQRTLSGQVLTAPSHVWPRDPSIPAGFPSHIPWLTSGPAPLRPISQKVWINLPALGK